MYGWTGKLLRVNLTENTTTSEDISKNVLENYLGGRGLGTKIIFDEINPKVNPLSSENKLVFAVGPLSKTKVPTSGRMSLSTKSPLTGTIFDSNAGGFWGAVLKGAGYDAVVIEGQSETPVRLVIEEENSKIKDASKLWGKGIKFTDKNLNEEEEGSYQNLMIGPAGENQVKFASISVNGKRSLGRGGVGAVMGAKKLKAISVSGNKKVEIADKEQFDFVNYELKKWIKANPLTSEAMPKFGTSMLVNLVNEAGALPTRNFTETQFEMAENISGEMLTDKILQKNSGCYNCPIRCERRTKTKNEEGHGPEYETVGLMGSNLGVGDIEAVAEFNYLCNDLGLDTITTGGTLSCFMEMAEKGIVEYDISFGEADKIKNLIEKIALREGIGEELARGPREFAHSYDAGEFAMEVKGLVLPAYDPRGLKGRGLGYITSNRGACHLRGNMLGPELLGVPKMIDRFQPKGKSGLLINQQNFVAIIDSLVLCQFLTFAVGEEFIARVLSAVTGVEKTQQDLLDMGERIWNIERIFNLNAGFRREDDRLPQRFLKETGSGPASNQVFEQEVMLDEYYRSRGWNNQGVPTEEKLKDLGLEGIDIDV